MFQCPSQRDGHLSPGSIRTLWMSHLAHEASPIQWKLVADGLTGFRMWGNTCNDCVCVLLREVRERGRASNCWRAVRSLGTRVIDSFCHTDRLWIICRHLTSWKANSGVLNFSTLVLMRRKLDFCVFTCKRLPLHNTRASSKNRVLCSCNCKFGARACELTDVTLCLFFLRVVVFTCRWVPFFISASNASISQKTRVHKVKRTSEAICSVFFCQFSCQYKFCNFAGVEPLQTTKKINKNQPQIESKAKYIDVLW